MAEDSPGTRRTFMLGGNRTTQWQVGRWTLSLQGSLTNQADAPLLDQAMTKAGEQIDRLLESITAGRLTVSTEPCSRSKNTQRGEITLRIVLSTTEDTPEDDDQIPTKLQAILVWALESPDVLSEVVNMRLRSIMAALQPHSHTMPDDHRDTFGILSTMDASEVFSGWPDTRSPTRTPKTGPIITLRTTGDVGDTEADDDGDEAEQRDGD